MYNVLVFSNKKHTDTLVEQKEPQETQEIKLNKQMESFSFSPLINLPEEWKWLLVVTYFNHRNPFSIYLMKTIAFQLLHNPLDSRSKRRSR